MAVTAIHQRPRRRPSSPLHTASLLALVVAWAAVFGVAYTLGSRSSASPQPAPPSLAPGSDVPASASRTISGGAPSAHRPAIPALHPLPAPPALKPLISHIVVRPRTYYVPVYRPAASASTPASPPAPTGGGPHGSGGTGGGTTTIGGTPGGNGAGGIGTTTTPTPTTSTPTGSTPSGG